MDTNTIYYKQVELLLDVLPYIKKEANLALKGGTGINLFIQNMPRLSIDIDLTYTLVQPRDEFLKNITAALNGIIHSLETDGFKIKKQYAKTTKQLLKFTVSKNEMGIKVEPNFVLRGTVYGVEEMTLVENAQNTFYQSQKMNVISRADLYAGKICASLDRQHPRDLFDICLLFDSGGITNEIRKAFVIYLASGPRPMSELLNPNKIDLEDNYHKEFIGMTNIDISYRTLLNTRDQLIKVINDSLEPEEKQFILSIKKGKPKWNLLELPGIENLPAINWKLMNIKKMDKTKHHEAIKKLEKVLNL